MWLPISLQLLGALLLFNFLRNFLSHLRIMISILNQAAEPQLVMPRSMSFILFFNELCILIIM